MTKWAKEMAITHQESAAQEFIKAEQMLSDNKPYLAEVYQLTSAQQYRCARLVMGMEE